MKVTADICVVPIGVGVSVSKHVAACERVRRDAGLEIKLHAYGKQCHEVVHEMGTQDLDNTQGWDANRSRPVDAG